MRRVRSMRMIRRVRSMRRIRRVRSRRRVRMVRRTRRIRRVRSMRRVRSIRSRMLSDLYFSMNMSENLFVSYIFEYYLLQRCSTRSEKKQKVSEMLSSIFEGFKKKNKSEFLKKNPYCFFISTFI